MTAPPLVARLNHAVLWTSDAGASAAFYRNVLGLEVAFTNRIGVFLKVPGSTNDHDLGSSLPPRASGSAVSGSASTTWRGRSRRCAHS